MEVKKIKGFICLAAAISVISTTVIMATNSAIKQNENQYIESRVIETPQFIAEVATTEKAEEVKEETIIATTENITEKTTEFITIKHTTAVNLITTKSAETTKPKEMEVQITKTEVGKTLYSASYFMNMGVIHWNGWKWTWYSERVLPGGGLNIPGRHADSDGYICDSDDYICLSSSSLSKGTVIATPFGKSGKVYDTGCASDTIDVYVNW